MIPYMSSLQLNSPIDLGQDQPLPLARPWPSSTFPAQPRLTRSHHELSRLSHHQLACHSREGQENTHDNTESNKQMIMPLIHHQPSRLGHHQLSCHLRERLQNYHTRQHKHKQTGDNAILPLDLIMVTRPNDRSHAPMLS